MISENEYLQVGVKNRIAKTAFDLSTTREFVKALNTVDEVDEQKVKKVSKKCIAALNGVKSDLDVLRSRLEGLSK
jgi:hypothetical protein